MMQLTALPASETYLSPPSPPENASPVAAAVAAAHLALKNLFPGNDVLLDDARASSLAAHGLSPADPGIAFGSSAAAAILALRANDHSSQAQFDYNAPGAGEPGVWVRLNNAPALFAWLGQCHAVCAAERVTISAGRTAGSNQRTVCKRLQ